MQVAFHSAAFGEMAESALYYEEARGGIGASFATEISNALALIMQYPEIGRPVGKRARTHTVARFPFNVIYEIRSDTIVVLAVMHHHRRPGYWRGRIFDAAEENGE